MRGVKAGEGACVCVLGGHSWNPRIRFLAQYSELHYHEFWPNYR